MVNQGVEAQRHHDVSDVADLDLATRSAQRLVYRRRGLGTIWREYTGASMEVRYARLFLS